MTFHGALTALLTPFRGDAVDLDAFADLVEKQIAGGIAGLVPCGTTGEAPTLSVDEHEAVVRACVDVARGRVPVMAGIGSNDTATAIDNARRAEKAGVQGVLATAPYYNKPTQEGLYRHFKAIAEAVGVEVCLYNVPGRSVVSIAPETVARLAEVPNITCVKEASGDMNVATRMLGLVGGRMALLSGDDFTVLPFVALGGVGTISVASNVVPERMVALVQAAREGRWDDARREHFALFDLFEALFVESNPIPVKTALALQGRMEERFRLPLCEIGKGSREKLVGVLRRHGLVG
jgi:4-hydroxy-tetrahydrodipicolinate synthase